MIKVYPSSSSEFREERVQPRDLMLFKLIKKALNRSTTIKRGDREINLEAGLKMTSEINLAKYKSDEVEIILI
jgi:hypothetical protein